MWNKFIDVDRYHMQEERAKVLSFQRQREIEQKVNLCFHSLG